MEAVDVIDNFLSKDDFHTLHHFIMSDDFHWFYKDYIAYQGDEKRYVRRDGVDGTKSRLRLPRVETVPPDLPELSFHTIKSMMEGDIDFDEFSPS